MNSNARNVQINGTSPKEDILAAIAGVWSSTEINGWNVIHISDRFEIWQITCNEAGSYMLPRTLDTVAIAKVFYTDGTAGSKVIKIQQKAINVTKACLVEVTITNI